MTVEVLRGGVTAKHWYGDPVPAKLGGDGILRVDFSIDSKGGGITQLQVRIDEASFADVIAIMMKVNRQATLQAIGQSLVQFEENTDCLDKALADLFPG